jgi:hypothetical protein
MGGAAMTDDIRDAALRAGVWQTIEKRAGELKNAAREELKALPFGDTVAGKHGDQVLCKASWTKGRQKVVVTDEAALLEWVKQNHPTEIVESVNPAFMRTFGTVGDQVHWQGEPVDFMEVQRGDDYITVKSNDETPFLVAQLFSGGGLSLDGVKAIEGEK